VPGSTHGDGAVDTSVRARSYTDRQRHPGVPDADGSTGGRVASESERRLAPFDGAPRIDRERLYDSGRFPNVVAATDGSVLATWGEETVRVRRSADGGETWGPSVEIARGRHGGGVVVDETDGDVLAFVEGPADGAPGSDSDSDPGTLYRSRDHGETWTAEAATVRADSRGNVPALHMCEHGIALRRGDRAGRLLRPARVYGTRGYNTAVYSDDGGETWRPSDPFPVRGTGEGAVAELRGGDLYYSSRKHHFSADEPRRHERLSARSTDGGETWRDPAYDEVLPDGPRYRGEERRGACYNGHFGMMGGLVRVPVGGADVLVYSNADERGYRRRRMTAWASFDGGETWPVKRRVFDGPSAYSSLAAGRPGTPSEGWLYLQFERGGTDGGSAGPNGRPVIEYAGSILARFTLSWLVRGEVTGDRTVPAWVSDRV
jgi:sialidase-1